MKTRILTIALLATTLGCYATPIDEAPSTPPTNVIAVFDDIIAWYQVPSETLLEEKRNATDNSIEHSVKVYTFQVEEYKHVIRDARQAFEKDAPLSYQYGLYEPGHKDTFRICTGDTPDKYIITRTQNNQGYYYIGRANKMVCSDDLNSDELKLLPFRTYYTSSKSGAGSNALMRFNIVFGKNENSDQTGISRIENVKENGAVYDLQGRRVENPTKGLYIVNGKKVMVK